MVFLSLDYAYYGAKIKIHSIPSFFVTIIAISSMQNANNEKEEKQIGSAQRDEYRKKKTTVFLFSLAETNERIMYKRF